MPAFGGSGSVVIAATLGMMAAVVFASSRDRRLAACTGMLAALTFAVAPVARPSTADLGDA